MKWDEVCRIARELPSVEDSSYHGYPALRVNGKNLVRLGDDRASLEFKAFPTDERDMLLASAPDLYFLPERFHGAGIFVRLKGLDRKTLKHLLQRRWRVIAPKSLQRDESR